MIFRRRPVDTTNTTDPFKIGRLIGAVEAVTWHLMAHQDDEVKAIGRNLDEVVSEFLGKKRFDQEVTKEWKSPSSSQTSR